MEAAFYILLFYFFPDCFKKVVERFFQVSYKVIICRT